jgi:hypothetical protein
MHHYRCQNVYISPTASERIVDTLEPPPQFPNATIVFHRQIDHGSQRHVQCIKNPHPEVPFAQIGDDTIEALTKLAELFKNKFQKVQTPGLSNAPAKAAENKISPKLSHPILASSVHQQCQTR